MRKRANTYIFVIIASYLLLLWGCAKISPETSHTTIINTFTPAITGNLASHTQIVTPEKYYPTKTYVPTIAPSQTVANKTPTGAPETNTPTIEYHDEYGDIDPSGQNLIFWHHYTKDRANIIQEIVANFNESNPWGITVVTEYRGYQSNIIEKLWEVLNTPYSPNLVMVYQNQAASFHLNDSLVNVETLLQSPKWGFSKEGQRDFYAGMLSQDLSPIYENLRLGFPPFRSMDVLYYNQDWLAELGYDHPPLTPDEFKEMACKAVQQPFSKAEGLESMGYGLSLDASRLASWTFAFGGQLFDNSTKQYTYDSLEVQNVMSFLQGMIAEGCATKISEAYADQEDFGDGVLLFSVGTSAGIPYYDRAVKNGANFHWSITAVPHTTEHPVQNVYGISFSIPKSTQEKELAAWLFIKYFTSSAVQAKWAEVSGYYPVRKSVEEYLTDYYLKYEAYHAGWRLLENCTYEPSVPGYELVRQKASEALSSIANGEDIPHTLDVLNNEANTILFDQLSLDLHAGFSEP